MQYIAQIITFLIGTFLAGLARIYAGRFPADDELRVAYSMVALVLEFAAILAAMLWGSHKRSAKWKKSEKKAVRELKQARGICDDLDHEIAILSGKHEALARLYEKLRQDYRNLESNNAELLAAVISARPRMERDDFVNAVVRKALK